MVYPSVSTGRDKQGFEDKEQWQSPYLCCCTLRSPQNHQENSQFWAGKQLFREGTETLQTTGRRAFKSALNVEKAVKNYRRHLSVFIIWNYFRLYLIRCLMRSRVIELRLIRFDLFSKKFRHHRLILSSHLCYRVPVRPFFSKQKILIVWPSCTLRILPSPAVDKFSPVFDSSIFSHGSEDPWTVNSNWLTTDVRFLIAFVGPLRDTWPWAKNP